MYLSNVSIKIMWYLNVTIAGINRQRTASGRTHLSFQIQLHHFLVGVSNSHESTRGGVLFRSTLRFNGLFFPFPATSKEVYTGGRAKKSVKSQNRNEPMVLKVYKYLPVCVHFHCYGISVIKSYFFCCYKSDM